MRNTAIRRMTGVAGIALLALLWGAAPASAQEVTFEPLVPTESFGQGGTQGVSTLAWDDGSAEGLVIVNQPFQIGTRFGGSPTTTALVPMQLLGASWGLLSNVPATVNVNIWHPLTPGGFPASPAPVGQFAGGVTTGVTVYAALGGTIIGTANGSVLVGLGVVPNTVSRVPVDTSAPQGRQFMGLGATTALAYGPATISNTVILPLNWLLRLTVDGNVPVELERFEIE